jgi:phosphoribosyl-ATP pyrophosphohydrolase
MTRSEDKSPESVLYRLAETLAERKTADPEASYVAHLYQEGMDAILKKVGEEAAETLLAAKDGEPKALVHEVADLWFHTLVLLTYQGLSPRDVTAELDRRFGVSGLTEKATRSTGKPPRH